MAENADENIELEDLSREREAQANEESETSFTDNGPGDESILIIDGSNPVFTRVDDNEPSTSDIPNVGRDAVVMKRHVIHDMKQFLKKDLGLLLIRGTVQTRQ